MSIWRSRKQSRPLNWNIGSSSQSKSGLFGVSGSGSADNWKISVFSGVLSSNIVYWITVALSSGVSCTDKRSLLPSLKSASGFGGSCSDVLSGVAGSPTPLIDGVLSWIRITNVCSDWRSFARNTENPHSVSLCSTLACVKPISIACGEEKKEQSTQKN